MRIDLDYLKSFLDSVLAHDSPDFMLNLPKFKHLHDNEDVLKTLVFHLAILEDQGLLESVGQNQGLGFNRFGSTYKISFRPLRLTAQGHQFAADLVKPGVFEKVKTSFKDSGPAETVKVVFALGKQIADKKLSELIE
ncbi:DUF2513 domain-containing protein [Vibrio cortegadensis]|uniref:DUF2513 domain-containing protein n=1 Tax=Vibrio cortegadensis TaxID=1328770 RepID=UPI0021C38C6E|nr:DUF2513 domain-containing protein [Vibrio cortegadensis]MDN3699646.1 DUF2513 domain-containing protein [Vibrio cortegadensis]